MTHPPRIPPTQDLPHQPPPPALAQPGTHAKVGLLRDQGVRSDAAGIAATLLDDCSGTPAGIAARLVELAEPIADWIRDGTRPDEFETHLATLDEWHP